MSIGLPGLQIALNIILQDTFRTIERIAYKMASQQHSHPRHVPNAPSTTCHTYIDASMILKSGPVAVIPSVKPLAVKRHDPRETKSDAKIVYRSPHQIHRRAIAQAHASNCRHMQVKFWFFLASRHCHFTRTLRTTTAHSISAVSTLRPPWKMASRQHSHPRHISNARSSNSNIKLCLRCRN